MLRNFTHSFLLKSLHNTFSFQANKSLETMVGMMDSYLPMRRRECFYLGTELSLNHLLLDECKKSQSHRLKRPGCRHRDFAMYDFNQHHNADSHKIHISDQLCLLTDTWGFFCLQLICAISFRKRVMAALALIIVRFIYIGQLSWALAVPLFMCMREH